MINNDKKNMTIIGGTRGLGRWIAEHLKEQFNITITSRNQSTGKQVAQEINVKYNHNNIDAIRNAQIIIFSVPIDHMVKTIEEVAPYAPTGSLLMDVASIKTEASEALKKYAPSDVEILPCHPMFGPRVPTLQRQIIVLTPVKNRSTEWLPRVKEFLEETDCEIVITTPQEHDKYMSIVQGLTHFSFISLASTIRKLNINVRKSRTFSSPVYSLMMDMVSRIVYQNPYLYYSIQKNNKETSNARQTLISESIYISKLIEEEDEKDFVKIILDSAEHLDEPEEALKRSDEAISMLTRKANLLKKDIGNEVGLKDQISDKVHVGILKKVKSKTLIIEVDDEEVTLNISDVDILSEEEVFNWKKNNLKLEHYDLNVLFPLGCDEVFLAKMFKNIEPVIDVEITDTSPAESDESLTCYTFHYTLFDKNENEYVEKYVKSVGGKIL